MNNYELAESWSSGNAVKYYLKNRGKIEDLYDSEKRFLPGAVKNAESVLDIGCATGGFSGIIGRMKKDINYTGCDISPEMVKRAKERFPAGKFYLTDGRKLDFPDDFFDLCVCFGVLHMTAGWKELLSEAWRVCRKAVLFDLRIVEGSGVSDANLSYQKIVFEEKWDGISKVPYVILNTEECAAYLAGLRPEIKSFRSYGYMHPVSGTAVSSHNSVCMSCFYLNKRGKENVFEWGLPLAIPQKIKKAVSKR